LQGRISRSRSRGRDPDQGIRMQFMPSLRQKALNQEKKGLGRNSYKPDTDSRGRKGSSRSESRGRSLSTSSTFSKRQKERDKIVFDFQKKAAAPRKHGANDGENPMELMPSLRHKAMSPKPDGAGCKAGREEQGSRGRSRSRNRNRCRSLSSTFASRSRSSSRSRVDQLKEGGDENKMKPGSRSRSRSVSWGRDNLEDKKRNLPSTRYAHLKPAIKKPEAISVPIHTPFKSKIRKEEDENPPKKAQVMPPSTEAQVHPPWRYGADMSSMMSSSAEMSIISQKSSTLRRSQLEQRERRRVSALKTWPDTTNTTNTNTNTNTGRKQLKTWPDTRKPTTDCTAGEVLHLPVTLSDCKNCKNSREGHHIPGDPACVIENMGLIKEEVKKRLRSMGKHGDFEIEQVKDNANGKLVYHMESAGKWQKKAQKTHIFA